MQSRDAAPISAPKSNPPAPVGGTVAAIFGVSSSGGRSASPLPPYEASVHSVAWWVWEHRYRRSWQVAVQVVTSPTLASSEVVISYPSQPT